MNYLENDIIFEDYNGWSNRDTWLVMLWINNDKKNYNKMQNKIKGIGVDKSIKELTNLELYNYLKKDFYYGDYVNFNKVNLDEIRKALLED